MPIGPNEAVIVNTHTGAQTKVRLDKPGSVDQGIDQIGSGYIRNDIKQALQARTGGQYQAEGTAAPAAGAPAALAAAAPGVQVAAPVAKDVRQAAAAGQPAGIGLDAADPRMAELLQGLQEVVRGLAKVVEQISALVDQGALAPAK